MGEIIQFKKPSLKEKHKGHSLCKSGFHKWAILDTPYDVKQGKMLTSYHCTRCGKTKTEKK